MSPKDYMDKQPALVREYMLGQLALVSFGWGFLPCDRYQWDPKAWARHYERFHGMSEDQFFGAGS